ncbi:GL16368 [Drosophila persimilis]|uniref:GL16368 n=1 Tax=Drosophila persimilis TaxID=7234 RepID=B4GWU3_DROPE|nr:GL16368 [Drosophila persimilis]
MGKEVNEILETIKTYAIHNRSNVVTEADIYHALKDDDDYGSILCMSLPAKEPGALKGGHAAACTDTHCPSATAKAGSGWQWEEIVELKPPKRFPLTKEQQAFYQTIIHACWGDDEDALAHALKSLQIDPSLEYILPQLTTHIVDGIDEGLYDKDVYQCIVPLLMAQALVKNRRITFNKHFHLILPSVLSCLLIQEAFEKEDVEGNEFHWYLRELASRIMGDIVRVIKSYNLLGRIIRTPPNEMDKYVAQYGHFGEYLYQMVRGLRVREHRNAERLRAELQLEAQQKFERENKVAEELLANVEAQKEITAEFCARLKAKRVADLQGHKTAEELMDSDSDEYSPEAELISELESMEEEIDLESEGNDAADELIAKLAAFQNSDEEGDDAAAVGAEYVVYAEEEKDDLDAELSIMYRSDSEVDNEDEIEDEDDEDEDEDEDEEVATKAKNPHTGVATEEFEIDLKFWRAAKMNSSSKVQSSELEENEYTTDDEDPAGKYFTDSR